MGGEREGRSISPHPCPVNINITRLGPNRTVAHLSCCLLLLLPSLSRRRGQLPQRLCRAPSHDLPHSARHPAVLQRPFPSAALYFQNRRAPFSVPRAFPPDSAGPGPQSYCRVYKRTTSRRGSGTLPSRGARRGPLPYFCHLPFSSCVRRRPSHQLCFWKQPRRWGWK